MALLRYLVTLMLILVVLFAGNICGNAHTAGAGVDRSTSPSAYAIR
ncbi:MAG: hypothetical protein NT169_23495 [Chloroflexi bacterium]|nr:hypothetical protein [Chloroflexota bacterium]